MARLANAQSIIQYFESWSPKKLAQEGDPIGLQIGTLNKPVKKIMVALDVLTNVVDEAVQEGVDLIIAHHPILYKPLKNINLDTPQGKMIEKLIKNDITVYAAHTNLDVARGGVNDLLAEALELENTEVLVPTYKTIYKKIAVFTPVDHADAVREALGNAGAGHIGNYSHCTFNTDGQGTFKPQDGADPYIGEQGKLEKVNEVKIESIFPAELESRVLKAVIKAHPYEEVAYDLVPMDNEGEELGLGKLGKLKQAMKLNEFAAYVKEKLDVDGVRVVGDLSSTVQRVAVLGGDGNKFVSTAKFRGADVFVSGDIYYHVAHDAMLEGLPIVDPGHNVEKVMKAGVMNKLQTYLESNKYETTVITSKEHTDPFQFL
ncbi:Nif3-like dinuclear metal center hexameric protein [Pseudalkalibacillus caeni]|uniref:GTP cyclohydrolase 1 type 2 homolog n=1 Tax=Exobacillus caeni TaxID=2574798 RepID=A0A5R9FIG8_9BACL|nr:Nif3-like dinuclear metal center hexameric protein [Pseudalkalibacillus caeni]TLS39375.1 Nif3-like dinuclear metal center hexameric protein [Pseudalkalibacillus caeni]